MCPLLLLICAKLLAFPSLSAEISAQLTHFCPSNLINSLWSVSHLHLLSVSVGSSWITEEIYVLAAPLDLLPFHQIFIWHSRNFPRCLIEEGSFSSVRHTALHHLSFCLHIFTSLMDLFSYCCLTFLPSLMCDLHEIQNIKYSYKN